MCSICTTSYGDDRYGPIYSGRYGFQGNAPGQTPWEKNDPNCPGCRVGAFAAGEARPPMPGVTNVKPAGQMMGYGPNVAYVDPSSGMEMARAYPVGMGSCPPGTYMTGMGACVPYPAAQARSAMTRTVGVRPAGQPLNDGPVPSSMASYAQNGRPFNAAPTRGTTMPPGFPLGFLPVGAGLDIPRGSMPMSPPAHILEPMVQWFGFQLK